MANLIANTSEVYAVANALGEPLNALPYSQVYVVTYFPFEDQSDEITLGYYASEAHAIIALANEVLTRLNEDEMDAPWNASLPDDYELSEKENQDRRLAWALAHSPQDIINNLFRDEDYSVFAITVEGSPSLGVINS